MKLVREDVYDLLNGERDYQDACWGPQTTASEGLHTPTEWLVYLQDYLTEAMHVASRYGEPEANEMVMDVIRKLGGMCVAAMEQNGAPARKV